MLIPVILQAADLNAVSSAPKGGDPWMGRIITYLSKYIGICSLAAYLHLELFWVGIIRQRFRRLLLRRLLQLLVGYRCTSHQAYDAVHQRQFSSETKTPLLECHR